MSTVIGWFLVTCPWSNSNVSRPGYNCAVVARTPSLFVCFCCMIVQIYNKALNIWFLGKLASFVFPRLPLGKHQDSRENKTNCFPRDHTLSVYYQLMRRSTRKLSLWNFRFANKRAASSQAIQSAYKSTLTSYSNWSEDCYKPPPILWKRSRCICVVREQRMPLRSFEVIKTPLVRISLMCPWLALIFVKWSLWSHNKNAWQR